MNVVTGGSGFIGQHVVAQLHARGEAVRIVDLVAPPTVQPGVDFIQGGITDPGLMRRALEGAETVYHAAAVPHLWAPDPSIYQHVNVDGSRIVFEEALRAKVRKVIHTSSATVLTAARPGRRPLVVDEHFETSEDDLFGHYAKSKWRAEAQARRFADRLPIVTVMPTMPLGPGDRHRTPPTRMLQDLLNGDVPAYLDCYLNIVDVRAVAAGHTLAAARGAPGRRYLLNQHSLDMKRFLQHLAIVTGCPMPTLRVPSSLALVASAVDEIWSTHVTGRAPRAPLAGTRMAVRLIEFSARRARTELGFPETPLLQTLTDAVEWLAEGGHVRAADIKTPLAFSGR